LLRTNLASAADFSPQIPPESPRAKDWRDEGSPPRRMGRYRAWRRTRREIFGTSPATRKEVCNAARLLAAFRRVGERAMPAQGLNERSGCAASGSAGSLQHRVRPGAEPVAGVRPADPGAGAGRDRSQRAAITLRKVEAMERGGGAGEIEPVRPIPGVQWIAAII
jgi:hypothetical protein